MALETTLLVFIAALISGVFGVLTGNNGFNMSLVMGFTSIDPYVVITMSVLFVFIAAIAAAAFFYRKGLTNFRLMILAALPYIVFALVGSYSVGYVSGLEDYADYGVKITFGFLAIIVALAFTFGSRIEYPEVKQVDSPTNKLRLAMSYEEKTLNERVNYWPVRAPLGILLFSAAGFVSGMFGIGAGWLIVPIFAFAMLIPLKVAIVCSMIVTGIANPVVRVWGSTVFSYVGGGFDPAIAVVGSIAIVIGVLGGAHIMLRVRAWIIRYLIAAILLISGVKLFQTGIIGLGLM